VTARKLHTMATLADELDALLPGLTTAAAPTLARTLIREVGRDHPSAQCVCPSVEITTDDRNRVLAKARKLYL
jgi:TctA family transporter